MPGLVAPCSFLLFVSTSCSLSFLNLVVNSGVRNAQAPFVLSSSSLTSAFFFSFIASLTFFISCTFLNSSSSYWMRPRKYLFFGRNFCKGYMFLIKWFLKKVHFNFYYKNFCKGYMFLIKWFLIKSAFQYILLIVVPAQFYNININIMICISISISQYTCTICRD